MTAFPLTRRLTAWTAALAVGAGVLTWSVVRPLAEPDDDSFHEPGPTTHATVGRHYDNGNPLAAGARLVTVTLPTSRVEIGVGAPEGTVDAGRDTTGDSRSFRAPEGGSLVQVESTEDPSYTTVPAGVGLASDPSYDLTLVVNGRSYVIRKGTASPGNVVAVAGTHPDLSVAVRFAGVSQSIDVRSGRRSPGRAAPLYTALRSGSTSCGTPVAPAPFRVDPAVAPVTCRLDYRRLPYVPTLGWAHAGSAWLLTSVSAAGPAVLVRPGAGGQVTTDAAADRSVTCGPSRATLLSPKPRYPGDSRRDGTTLFACAVPAAGAVPTVTVAEGLLDDVTGGAGMLRWTVAP